ncbi:protein of unknown function [Magnetospirillum gryphiswaldense MSR-1 v2]|uniref:Uncharacterized protein n=1 Tax=Magnetospirillum gryphiswaldense (strain DSM 6361 / JCM 21280 / NBRC 15271 / MSR-1) TaxID=431944 RepID=V6F5I6_MAGGM|nr:protein of unknown function [Magnetospirillum gryphiswaldense MSR-1 v2]
MPWDSEFTVYMYTLMQAAPNMPIATSPGPMLMVRGGAKSAPESNFDAASFIPVMEGGYMGTSKPCCDADQYTIGRD